ncbi:MAG: winged-helix domain-containing protein [Dehalococcoidia bacterium]
MQGLKAVLAENGYSSDLISSPPEDLGKTAVQDTRLIFLDVPYLNRTGADVGALIERCRGSSQARLIAMLAPDNPEDFGFARKVDDFITYPYSRHEVMARVQNLGSTQSEVESENVIRRGELTIDVDRYEVMLGPEKIGLTYKEYELLKFLASNPGIVYSRDTLLDRVWGYNYFGGTRTVDVHIRRLRGKIESGDHSFIETIRSVGYRFRPEPMAESKMAIEQSVTKM